MASEKLADGVYFIQNIGTGTVLTLHGGSAEDGTLAEGTAKRELSDPWVSAQLWIITKVIVDDGRTYSVQNGNSRRMLGLNNVEPYWEVTCATCITSALRRETSEIAIVVAGWRFSCAVRRRETWRTGNIDGVISDADGTRLL